MGRIISRHLEELATPRISEWGPPFLLEEARLVEGASQDRPCWWSEVPCLLSEAIVEPVVACGRR